MAVGVSKPTHMKILITGSSGHLGHALTHSLVGLGHEICGVDVNAAGSTHRVGSIGDRSFVREVIRDVDAVVHTATLHKPHVATHSRQDFVDTNITGTLNLLEEAVATRVKAFVFTSTTSVFGRAMMRKPGEPAAWITEDVVALPKNIYGITKLAAENLCELIHRKFGLPCLILRTSRFFPEQDDDEARREAYCDDNLKVNELLYRRADIADIASAHVRALETAPVLGFDRFIISATTPFELSDIDSLGTNTPEVVSRYVPGYADTYARLGWRMLPTLDRVYVNERARERLGWEPQFNFATVLDRLRSGLDYRSDIARLVGSKGYHAQQFTEGPYPVG
jgi:UDP-glucose 4-epimerase